MAAHNDFGTEGEKISEKYLKEDGYLILEKNWRFMKAEIDLIAQYEDQLVFVEVKSRTSNQYGQPEDFVSRAKQKFIARAADEYIYIRRHPGEVRFDIISILFDNFGKYQLNHIKDAFWP